MIKAMLACSTVIPIAHHKLPLYASYKLDGIRAIAWHGVAISRNGLPLPNLFVQSIFKEQGWHGFDGELMLNDPKKDFNDVQSEIMRSHGSPDFRYEVFDSTLDLNKPFEQRWIDAAVGVRIASQKSKRIKIIDNTLIQSHHALEELYIAAQAAGFEGLITRDPYAKYKQGRSTQKQQWMMKLKPVLDAEGIIIDFEELMHNADTSSKRKDNMYGGDTLGAFVLKWKDVTVKVGTGKGLTAERRKEFWEKRNELLGLPLTFGFQELSKYGIPRFTRFKGIRYEQFRK
jgi:DNA ligase-1